MDTRITPYDWQPVKGYEGLYEVSTTGRVRSKGRVVAYRDGRVRRFPEKELRTPIDSVGYPYVNLYGTDRKGKTWRVHELVARAFLPNPEGHPLVRHLNDIKEDNRVQNLAWGSADDNAKDKYRNGYVRKRPTHCKRGHELKGENEKVRADGRRNCKRCLAAYSWIHYRNGKVTEEAYARYFESDEQRTPD